MVFKWIHLIFSWHYVEVLFLLLYFYDCLHERSMTDTISTLLFSFVVMLMTPFYTTSLYEKMLYKMHSSWHCSLWRLQIIYIYVCVCCCCLSMDGIHRKIWVVMLWFLSIMTYWLFACSPSREINALVVDTVSTEKRCKRGRLSRCSYSDSILDCCAASISNYSYKCVNLRCHK